MRRPLAVLVLTAVASTVAAAPADRCTPAKLRAAARKATHLIDCEAKAAASAGTTDADCLVAARQAFSRAWQRIEAKNVCPPTASESAVEAEVDAFVAEVVASLRTPATSSTTTATPTTTSCPPTTAFYCGVHLCGGFPALCPSGMQCVDTGPSTCACQGDPIPCGELSGGAAPFFCQWGTCPDGMTCGAVAHEAQCSFDCACH